MFVHIPHSETGGRTYAVLQIKKSSCPAPKCRVFGFKHSIMTPRPIQLSPTRPGAALYSRPPLERMMRMHERLKAGRYPNCRKLADELEVSSKTVQRDIDFMRYRLGLPIEYDQLHFGFYYTEPVVNFPNIEISEGELIALTLAKRLWPNTKARRSRRRSPPLSVKSRMASATPFP